MMASTQSTSSPSLRVCFNCGQTEGKPPLKKCAKCSTALYCSRQCQTAHWKTHKDTCHKPKTKTDTDQQHPKTPMMGPWNENLYKATTPQALKRWKLSPTDVQETADELPSMTRHIYGDPQNPAHLITRAMHLWRLGFADLAAGDAYRAMLPLSQHLSAVFGGPHSSYEELSGIPLDAQDAVRGVSEVHKGLCLKRATILMDMLNLATAQAVIKEARVNHPSDAMLAQTEKHLAAEMEKLEEAKRLRQGTIHLNFYCIDSNLGGVHHLAYPFVPEEFLGRSEELIRATKTEIENEAKNLSSGCSLGSSPVQDSADSTNRGTPTALGIFATGDIPKGQAFLLDITVLAATRNNRHTPNAPEICDNCCGTIPTTSPLKRAAACCAVLYCSQKCKDLAWKNYHQVLCKQDFRWVWEDSKMGDPQYDLDGPMWLRILAVCVQSDRHPLEHPLIARLTPLYDESLIRQWSLANNIIMPNKILKQLGIDIYTDSRFDI